MTELQFLVNMRRLLLSAVAMLDKRIEFLRCIPTDVTEMEIEMIEQNNGQGLVEYALIIVLVAIVAIVVLLNLGPSIANLFSTVNASFPAQ